VIPDRKIPSMVRDIFQLGPRHADNDPDRVSRRLGEAERSMKASTLRRARYGGPAGP